MRMGSCAGRRRAGRRLLAAAAALLVSGSGAWAQQAAGVVQPSPGLQQAMARGPLTLSDIIGVALENNPNTRAAWAQARAAAASYGSSKGHYFPTITLTPTWTRTQAISAVNRGAALPSLRTQYGPSVSLSYLLFDFGGRGGTVDQAQSAAVAATDLGDATVQTTVLQAEQAYFAYNAARDLLEAEQANLHTATESRSAAIARYHVGLATAADTLQAATAVAQAQLELLTAQGGLQTARGSLAAAMGTSAQLPFDVAPAAEMPPVQAAAVGVDSLIAQAVRERPDLAAARAQAIGAEGGIKVARSAELPSLTMSGNAGRTLSNLDQLQGNSWGLTFGIQIPVFSGFSRQNDVRAAEALADAARARADATAVQVANQVFTSYTSLQIAAARVNSSAQLLASAVQSEAVARGRYAEGVGSFIDLLVAQNALASARAQDAQARWGWYTSLSQLAHDVGTLDRSGDARLPMTNDTTSVPKVIP